MNALPCLPSAEIRDSYDVVVVGAGGGGLTAAVAAAATGADVLLLEKTSLIGGTYAYSGGLVWAPDNYLARADGVQDSLDLAREHITTLSAGKHDPAVVDAYLSHMDATLTFLGERGVPFEWVPGVADYYADQSGGMSSGRYLASPLFEPKRALPETWRDRVVVSPYYGDLPVTHREIVEWGGYGNMAHWDRSTLAARKEAGVCGFGMATIGYLLAASLTAGVNIRLDAELDELETRREDRSVTGVVVRMDGALRRVATRYGVVLACGGYDGSADMQRRFDPHPPVQSLTYPGVDGSGFSSALQIGATLVNHGGQFLAPRIIPLVDDPDERYRHGFPVNKEIGQAGAFVVNRSGHRFADDSYVVTLAHKMVELDYASMTYPNADAWLIVDGHWLEMSRGRLPMLAQGNDAWLVEAATPEALAEKIDVPVVALAETMLNYNKFADRGEDPEFGRGSSPYVRSRSQTHEFNANPCLRALSAPYFALALGVASMGTLSGLWADACGAVLRADASPVGGLYACGNTMANNVGGLWFNSGVPNGAGLVFGRLAAKAALTSVGR